MNCNNCRFNFFRSITEVHDGLFEFFIEAGIDTDTAESHIEEVQQNVCRNARCNQLPELS